MLLSCSSHTPRLPSPSPPKPAYDRRSFILSMASSHPHKETWRSPLLEFPYLTPSHRNLMLNLISTVGTRIGAHLLPSTVPPPVARFHNDSGTAEGAIDIRSGGRDSKIDFILGSWLHCKLPSGAALDIATLFSYLNSRTDAPHLLLEFIQSSPTSVILFMDLLPRRDLVLHPDYLETFYQNTQIDQLRGKLQQIPGAKPYFSSSLYIRSVLSPTAIAVSIDASVDEVMRDHISGVAEELVKIWLEECAIGGRETGDVERGVLVRRDDLLKRKTVEIDLAANLPRLFGPEVAGRIMGEIQKVFGIA